MLVLKHFGERVLSFKETYFVQLSCKKLKSVKIVNEIISMLKFFNPFKKAGANDVLYL